MERSCYLSLLNREGGASEEVDKGVIDMERSGERVTGMICEKKVPTNNKLLVYQTNCSFDLPCFTAATHATVS